MVRTNSYRTRPLKVGAALVELEKESSVLLDIGEQGGTGLPVPGCEGSCITAVRFPSESGLKRAIARVNSSVGSAEKDTLCENAKKLLKIHGFVPTTRRGAKREWKRWTEGCAWVFDLGMYQQRQQGFVRQTRRVVGIRRAAVEAVEAELGEVVQRAAAARALLAAAGKEGAPEPRWELSAGLAQAQAEAERGAAAAAALVPFGRMSKRAAEKKAARAASAVRLECARLEHKRCELARLERERAACEAELARLQGAVTEAQRGASQAEHFREAAARLCETYIAEAKAATAKAEHVKVVSGRKRAQCGEGSAAELAGGGGAGACLMTYAEIMAKVAGRA